MRRTVAVLLTANHAMPAPDASIHRACAMQASEVRSDLAWD